MSECETWRRKYPDQISAIAASSDTGHCIIQNFGAPPSPTALRDMYLAMFRHFYQKDNNWIDINLLDDDDLLYHDYLEATKNALPT